MQWNRSEPAGRHQRRCLMTQVHLGLRAMVVDTVLEKMCHNIRANRPFQRVEA